jgi:hypothetical protein
MHFDFNALIFGISEVGWLFYKLLIPRTTVPQILITAQIFNKFPTFQTTRFYIIGPLGPYEIYAAEILQSVFFKSTSVLRQRRQNTYRNVGNFLPHYTTEIFIVNATKTSYLTVIHPYTSRTPNGLPNYFLDSHVVFNSYLSEVRRMKHPSVLLDTSRPYWVR